MLLGFQILNLVEIIYVTLLYLGRNVWDFVQVHMIEIIVMT
jgi:hypothetical protein